MFRRIKMRLRKWFATLCARLHQYFVEYDELQQLNAIDDYLRVQNLRRYEEARFRRMYGGPRI